MSARTDERLDPVQEAFIDHAAVQCGLCTAGMLLTAKALLVEDPAPTRERVWSKFLGGFRILTFS